MELHLNKNNCFLLEQIVNICTQCQENFTSVQGVTVQEKVICVHKYTETTGSGKFLVEKYMSLIEIVGGNTRHLC